MKQKSNPWVALVALILMLVLVVCACTGCTCTAEAAEPESPRFIVEEAETKGARVDYIVIITDTETGVQYMFVKDGYGGGLTVLEPAPEKEGAE